MSKNPTPLALFDFVENRSDARDFSYLGGCYNLSDLSIAVRFLYSYKGSQGTFNSYHREIERLIHWGALVANQRLQAMKRDDIKHFIAFCQKPPRSWVGQTKPPRFIVKDGVRVPNPDWRPFIHDLAKVERRKGAALALKSFALAHGSLREISAILSRFFN